MAGSNCIVEGEGKFEAKVISSVKGLSMVVLLPKQPTESKDRTRKCNTCPKERPKRN